ncbi:hypothetical protein [Bacillus sp. J33]|uniref:hypothetical protein n=1 Tax=Bacillus sp. J33 TaxID=935836 RepID=UPI000554A1A6|nr:hypothetical protein [Bacillus sp. J33]
MSKNLMPFSIGFLGVCILIGSWFISQSFHAKLDEKIPFEDTYRYELISVNDNNIILFDKQSGVYWQRYISANEGPTDWEKQSSPVSKQ